MRLPVYDERKGHFAAVRNERVLIYWPHGFGDFIHFGYVAPLLEPSNEYFITRFGDDFVQLYDEGIGVKPVLSGVRAIGDGSAQGARHLGIEWKKIRNDEMELTLTEPLAEAVHAAGITAVLYTDYPEYEGKREYPYHTKARALIKDLVASPRLETIDLEPPMSSAIAYEVPAGMRTRIETRLRDWVAPGEHLYLVAPGGHTNAAKTWAPEHVSAFERDLAAHDPRGRTLVIDERSLRERFGDLDVPFAHLLTTLVRSSSAFVGAAAGPLHAALAMHAVPVVGIWLAHHPDWYDEPNRDAIHLTGPRVHAKGYDKRKATLTKPIDQRARTLPFLRRIPDAADVFQAFRLLR